MSTLLVWLSHPCVVVGLGGAVGANLRYWVGRWFKSQPWASDFFWGTLLINIVGSILLGLFVAWFPNRSGTNYLLLGTGLCGGFTTFSTFSLEVMELIQKQRWDLAVLYIFSSVLGGVLGLYIAWSAARGWAA